MQRIDSLEVKLVVVDLEPLEALVEDELTALWGGLTLLRVVAQPDALAPTGQLEDGPLVRCDSETTAIAAAPATRRTKATTAFARSLAAVLLISSSSLEESTIRGY